MPGIEINRAFIVIMLVGITIVLAVAINTGGIPAGPDAGTGILTGNVSIGPLCPVEPCTLSHDQRVAAYSSRPITISMAGGTVVASVIADPVTGYMVSLKPGTYVVDIPNPGIGGSQELPKTVTIRSGETVRLDITIETGIR
jgi:hypothetical protein